MVLFYALLILFFRTCLSEICLLCTEGVQGLRRPHYVLDNGSTCGQAMVDSAVWDATDKQCTLVRTKYEATCCGVEDPPPSVYRPPDPVVRARGPFPSCDICNGKGVVKNRLMVINILYVGVGTCVDYQEYANLGHVPRHMCAPLQHYAREPCGCD